MALKQDKRPIEVAILLYDGCQTAMVHGISDLVAVASSYSLQRGGPELCVTHWSRSDAGDFLRSAEEGGASSGIPDMLVVPGRLAPPMSAMEAAPFVDWVRTLHARGTVIASNCNGAFLLGYAGLLEGRSATTHWQFSEEFQQRFPGTTMAIDQIVVDDGDIITAGGMMAWTDLGVRLTERLLGAEVVTDMTRFLLIDPGGREQRHYGSFVPRLRHGDEPIVKVQRWLQERDGRNVSIPQMAEVAGLEERTFLRRFKAATGLKPTEYSQSLRIAKARNLLEHTKRTVDQIAWSVGYEDPAAFRRIFQRSLGLSATEYRHRFSVGAREDMAANQAVDHTIV